MTHSNGRISLPHLRPFVRLWKGLPMWPEGYYNAALLAAETEDYELAAHHMRSYLVHSPVVKETPSAKDMLLLWLHKARQ